MQDLLKRNRYLVVACGVLSLLVVLLSLRSRDNDTAHFIDEAFQGLTYPFQTAYHETTGFFSSLFTHYVYLVNLEQENERLQLQVKALKEELNHYVNSAIQFDLLREQLNFLEENPDKKVFAEVIGESSDSLHHVLLINKGTRAGIRRNFPVVLREGVVGRVQSATLTQSVVELMIDRRHRLPVMIQSTRERLILQGDNGGMIITPNDRGVLLGTGDGLQVQRVRMLADLQVGDRVITSGLAGIFPKGLLVGTLTKVWREPHELFQVAEVRPAVDFNKIEGVFVILRDDAGDMRPLFTKP